MSSDLRRRLQKVLTPAIAPTVRTADGSTPAVLGMCTARLTISEHQTSVLFAVLENCPHDLILGLDFLTSHAALIDCSKGLLQLELPSFSETVSTSPPRLRSVDFLRLPPQAAVQVQLSS